MSQSIQQARGSRQLREAFPFESAPRCVIFDRDAKYGLEVPAAARSLSVSPVRTSFESPWQNGVAERWVGSCRRDLLDHIIAVDERHLKRLLSEYIRYYHEDRTHLGLGKGTPDGRTRTVSSGHALSQARLGGLHHPVRSGCLIRSNVTSRKRPGSCILRIYRYTARAFFRESSWRSRMKG
jgi:putative transposase